MLILRSRTSCRHHLPNNKDVKERERKHSQSVHFKGRGGGGRPNFVVSIQTTKRGVWCWCVRNANVVPGWGKDVLRGACQTTIYIFFLLGDFGSSPMFECVVFSDGVCFMNIFNQTIKIIIDNFTLDHFYEFMFKIICKVCRSYRFPSKLQRLDLKN